MKHRQENNETSTAFFLKNKIHREVRVIRKQWINFFSQGWLRTVDNKNNRTPNPRRPSVILFFKRHRKRETCSLKNKLWRKWLEEEILSFYRCFWKWGAGRIRAECTVIGLESFGKLWAFQGLDNFEWMSGREIDRVEIPPTIHFSRCRGGHSSVLGTQNFSLSPRLMTRRVNIIQVLKSKSCWNPRASLFFFQIRSKLTCHGRRPRKIVLMQHRPLFLFL